MKLTKAQWETLIDVERGGDIGAKYSIAYRPIVKLRELGLVVADNTPRPSIYFKRYILTPAGRAALESQQ